jgi:hypothetical protein
MRFRIIQAHAYWLRRATAILAIIEVVSSCAGRQPIDGPPVESSPVKVSFPAPVTVAAVAAPGDSVWLQRVIALRGEVQRSTSDTIYLRISGAWRSNGRLEGIPPGRVAAIARSSEITVRRETGTGKAVGQLVLIALLTGAVLLVMMFSDMPES